MTEPQTKLNIFRTFDKCPACDSTERIFANLYKKAEKEGNTLSGATPTSFSNVVTLVNPRSAPIIGSTVKGYQIVRDICDNCGLEYPFMIVNVLIPIK